MKKYEEQYKEDILNNLEVPDNYEKIASQIEFNHKKERRGFYFMKKGLVIGMSVAAIAIVAAGTIGGVALNNNNKTGEANAVLTMDLNPSVKFVLDENNKVIAVDGENDEGKMIVCGEKIVGKDISAAIEIVLKQENETGYLVSGSASVGDNNLQFSLTINDNVNKSQIESKVEKTVKDTCAKLDVKVRDHIEVAEGYTRAELEELVLSYDSSLTEEDVKNMTYKQLFAAIQLHTVETAELYSTELVDLYEQGKNYKISLAESEYTKEVVSSLGEAYQGFLTSLDTVIESLKGAIDSVNQLRYETFVKEDCSYQVALKQLQETKKEYLADRQKVAEISDPVAKALAEAQLTLVSTLLDTYEVALTSAKEAAETAIDASVEIINGIIDEIEETKKELMTKDEFENKVNSDVATLDKELNNAKDTFYSEFENAHKDDVEAAKKWCQDYKASLKKTVKGE